MGVELIKSFEGLRLKAYKDSVGVWTIGYGHTRTAKEGMEITQLEAEALLRNDIAIHEAPINQVVGVELKQHQFDALSSFIFNMGGSAFRGSTLLSKLNDADYIGAAAEFLRWHKAGGQPNAGLIRRRMTECQMFLFGE